MALDRRQGVSLRQNARAVELAVDRAEADAQRCDRQVVPFEIHSKRSVGADKASGPACEDALGRAGELAGRRIQARVTARDVAFWPIGSAP